MYVGIYFCVHMHMWVQYPQKPEENTGSFQAGVIDGYELPDLGARNHTWVLYKNSKHC